MHLEFDTRDIDRAVNAISGFPREMNLALRKALRRAGTHMAKNISAGIKNESFLKAGEIRKALGKPVIKTDGSLMSAEIRVASRKKPVDHFKIIPRRITARKGKRSVNWPSPAYRIGPHEPVVRPGRSGALSRPFAARIKGRLMLLRRSGKDLLRMFGYSAQYFAAFESTKKAAFSDTGDFFTRTLLHEIEYRLGVLK